MMAKQYRKGSVICLPNTFEDAYAECCGVYPDCYAWRLSFDNILYFISKDCDQYQELMQRLAYDPHYQGFSPC